MFIRLCIVKAVFSYQKVLFISVRSPFLGLVAFPQFVLNRISHPDWVKLCIELNYALNQNTKIHSATSLFYSYLVGGWINILHSEKSFIIKVFWTIVFIFIVISTTLRPICPPAFFRCLSNSGTFTEIRTTSFIETMGVACSDSISHNWVQVLSIPVTL